VITIKSDEEVKIMREAGRVVGEVLQILKEATKPGVVVKELDKIVRKEYAKRGVIPTFLGYGEPPYPATVCISVNDELVHGIPGDRVIKEGDIVSIDLGATYKGFVGDSAITVGVGEVSAEAQKLIDVTRQSLYEGIKAARPGARLGAISNAIGSYIAGAELRPGRPRSHPEAGHGARPRADGDDRRLRDEGRSRRLDGQHDRRQSLRPLRAHNRDNGR
jgi:methionyl aminopeptidase